MIDSNKDHRSSSSWEWERTKPEAAAGGWHAEFYDSMGSAGKDKNQEKKQKQGNASAGIDHIRSVQWLFL